jgi:6-phosphogluconate dehydrogenase
MELAMIGLGRMGGNMARRLLAGGHRIVLHNRTAEVAEQVAAEAGAGQPLRELADLPGALAAPRHAWLMLPAGQATELARQQLFGLLAPGDLIVDGGNANYKDTRRRAALAADRGLQYVDVGVSGGVWGLSLGYGLMVGGAAEAVERIRPALESLAPAPDMGWAHLGASGAGHYAKMIHNGIEYGMMQAIAEGLEIMRARSDYAFDLAQVTEAWRHGTVIRSWLLDLTAEALKNDPDLASLQGHVSDSGEGRWTIQEAIDLDVPAPVITQALFHRFYSRGGGEFASKLLAAMRLGFGGHAVRRIP